MRWYLKVTAVYRGRERSSGEDDNRAGSDMPSGMPIPMPSPHGAHPEQPQNCKARTENTESNLGSKLAVPLSQGPSSAASVLEIKRLCIKTLRGLKENWGLCVWLTPSCTMDKQLLFICWEGIGKRDINPVRYH